MKVFYSDTFVLPLPEGHRFPMAKYSMLRERVASAGFAELHVPEAVTDAEILRSHDADYLRRAEGGTLTRQEIRRIGFPWSERMIQRSRRASGGTVGACLAALKDGLAANLAGGTHHAFRDRGEGFCVFNDSSIAARAMQAARHVERVLIVDTDVHQGNGTASILRDDPSIFTFSIHGEKNFPFHKETSDLDIPLPDGADDSAYLDALASGLDEALDAAGAEMVIFLAGADPLSEDRLGRLSVTKAGLTERDRMILETCSERGLPVAVTMAGGYACRVEDTVDVHFATIERAATLMNKEHDERGIATLRPMPPCPKSG